MLGLGPTWNTAQGGREARGSHSQSSNYTSVLCNQPGYIVHSNYLHMAPGRHTRAQFSLPTFTGIPRDIYRKVFCGSLAGLAGLTGSDPNLQMRVPVSKKVHQSQSKLQLRKGSNFSANNKIISNKFISQSHSKLSPKMHFQGNKSISHWVVGSRPSIPQTQIRQLIRF